MTSASSDDAMPSDCITNDELMHLKNRWSCVRNRMRLWLRKLDSSLPGILGEIADWLFHAEECLRTMPHDEYDSPSSALKGIQQQLADISVKCFSAVLCLITLFECDVFGIAKCPEVHFFKNMCSSQ